MLDLDIIEPISIDWVSSLVVVLKPGLGNDLCRCLNDRKVNAFTKPINFRSLGIETLTHNVFSFKYSVKLGFAKGLW